MKTLNIGSGKYKDNNGEWSTLPCLKGDKGDTGESAYQLAVRLGTFTGTEEEYNKQFSEIVRKTNAAEKSIKEAENKIQENIKNIGSLSKDLKTKINIPLENPEIGKVLKVKSVNEDGTFVCEWADSASDLDVQIDGKSIVQNGVAEIPVVKDYNTKGLVKLGGIYNGLTADDNGVLRVNTYSQSLINGRSPNVPICAKYLDDSVKAAMCDGKGAAWTTDEQVAARERMGIYDWEDILDVTLEEDGAVDLDLNRTFKDLYLYINQSNVETPITGATFLTPYCVDDFGYFNSYYPSITTSFKDIAAIWHYNENMAYRYACATNPQKESTGTQIACLKVWDKNSRTDSKIYPSGAFIKLKGLTVWKAKTRIVVKGVRA